MTAPKTCSVELAQKRGLDEVQAQMASDEGWKALKSCLYEKAKALAAAQAEFDEAASDAFEAGQARFNIGVNKRGEADRMWSHAYKLKKGGHA